MRASYLDFKKIQLAAAEGERQRINPAQLLVMQG